MHDRKIRIKNAPYYAKPYTKQIIINFAGRLEHLLHLNLKRRWYREGHAPNSCVIMSMQDLLDRNYQGIELSLDDYVRVYIDSHASPGVDYLVNNSGKVGVKCDQLAISLLDLLGDIPATISLYGCSAGRGSSWENEKLLDDVSGESPAAILHKFLGNESRIGALSKTSVDTLLSGRRKVPDVVARASSVGAHPVLTSKRTLDLYSSHKSIFTLRFHHQPGSKVRFTIDDEGKQIRLDSYTYKLKTKVITVINKLAHQTKVTQKQKLLQRWAKQFPSMTPEEIFKIIATECIKKDSVLRLQSSKRHSVSWLWAYATGTATQNALHALLDEAYELYKWEFTSKSPIATGHVLRGRRHC